MRRLVLLVAAAGCRSNESPFSECNAAVDSGALSAGGISFSPRSATAGLWPSFFVVYFSRDVDVCGELLLTDIPDASIAERYWLEIELGATPRVGAYRILAQYSGDGTGIGTLTHVGAGTAYPFAPDRTVAADSGTVHTTFYEERHRIAGDYDLHFVTGERLVGTFDVPFCSSMCR